MRSVSRLSIFYHLIVLFLESMLPATIFILGNPLFNILF